MHLMLREVNLLLTLGFCIPASSSSYQSFDTKAYKYVFFFLKIIG